MRESSSPPSRGRANGPTSRRSCRRSSRLHALPDRRAGPGGLRRGGRARPRSGDRPRTTRTIRRRVRRRGRVHGRRGALGGRGGARARARAFGCTSASSRTSGARSSPRPSVPLRPITSSTSRRPASRRSRGPRSPRCCSPWRASHSDRRRRPSPRCELPEFRSSSRATRTRGPHPPRASRSPWPSPFACTASRPRRPSSAPPATRPRRSTCPIAAFSAQAPGPTWSSGICPTSTRSFNRGAWRRPA